MIDDYVWIKDDMLIMLPEMVFTCNECVCDCKPKVLVKYTLPPNGTWDLTPYMVEGFAKPAPYKRKWQIRECSGGVRYQKGDILYDGTLVDLPDHFDARYSYNGYMQLQCCCIDDNGNLIEPSCDRWW